MLLAIVVPADVAGRAPQVAGRPAKGVPVTGTCLDEEGQPLAGVKVTLYRDDSKAKKHENLGERVTGADGRFEFADAPAPGDESGLAVVVTMAGRGSIIQPLFAGLPKPLEFRVRPAGTLQGKVTDAAGKPVAGAHVWARGLGGRPIDGISTAVTDAEGKYAIADMGRWTGRTPGRSRSATGWHVGQAESISTYATPTTPTNGRRGSGSRRRSMWS